MECFYIGWNKMTQWAIKRREFIEHRQSWWKDDYHLRIGGNGFTPISLNDSSALRGIGSGVTNEIKNITEERMTQGTRGVE